MQKITRATLTAIGLLPFSLFADSAKLDSIDVMRESRVIAELQQGKKTGGFIDGMIPFYGNNEHIWFTNLQAYKYGNQYQTYGLGLGHRAIVDDAVYGLYGFYDWQQSENKKNYGRVSVGVERLTDTWDVRANFSYYVFKDTNKLLDEGLQSSFIEGNNIYNRHYYDAEKIYSGVSAEVGRTLGTPDLRGYVGAYTYGGEINGVSARLQYQVTDRISLVAAGQHDTVRGWLATGGIQYWIGASRNTGNEATLADRLRDPIVRDMTLPAKVDFDHFDIEKDPRSIYFADPNITQGGDHAATQADPSSLSDAINKAGENDYVYLMNGNGDPFTLTDNVTLKNGQTLWGNTNTLYIDGRLLLTGDTTARPTVSGGGITLANNNTINGITITGDGNQYGILGSGISNATLSDIHFNGSFSGTNNSAIDLQNVSTANLSSINIDATAEKAFNAASSTGVTLTSSTINGTYTNAGIYVTGAGTSATVSNSSITNADSDAIYVYDNASITVNSSTVKSTNDNGVYIDQNSSGTLTNVTANSNGQVGIQVSNTSSVVIKGGTASNNGSYGVIITGSNSTITDITTNNNLVGMYFSDGSNSTITDITANNNLIGIYFSNATGTNRLKSITSKENTRDGIIANNSVVNISGDTIVKDNQRVGIFALNNSTVTITGGRFSSLQPEGTGVEALRVQDTSSITMTNPTELKGSIISTSDTSSITVNGTSTVGDSKTCSIENGSGSCT